LSVPLIISFIKHSYKKLTKYVQILW